MVSSPKKGSSKKIAKKTYVYVRSSSIAPTTTTNSSSSETTANSNACWIPAILIQQNGTKDAIVSVPMYKSDQELFDIGTDSKLKFEADHRIVDLKDYDNNVLPMQNVAPNGNLEDYKDMVELPFMHEVCKSIFVVDCFVLTLLFLLYKKMFNDEDEELILHKVCVCTSILK